MTDKYNSIGDGAYEKFLELMPQDGIGNYSASWLATKLLEEDKAVLELIEENMAQEAYKEVKSVLSSVENGVLETAGYKFKWIDELLKDALVYKEKKIALSKFDSLATHKTWGKPLAILIILLGLIASFIPATPFMLVGSLVPKLGEPISAALAPSALRKLL